MPRPGVLFVNGRLTITSGEGSPSPCDIQPGEAVTLGRHRSNRIVLRDLHASRQHAELFFDNGQWFLRDFSTLNGTRLNGQRIHSPQPLKDGAEISIGDTRLAFTCEAPTQEADEPSWAEDKKKDAPERAEPVSDPNPTILQADELTALCSFMTSSVEETSPRALVARALSLIHRQTWATLVGFLSLDAEQPLPQMVVPDQADVDASLSRQLTQAVQKSGRLVWLAVRPLDEDQSESLASLTDAVCVPLRASDTELGALHVYKDKRTFTEREVLFIEVLAGFLAKSLYVLRGHRNLVAENVRLRGRSKPHVEGMVGNSPALGQVRQQVEKVGPLDCTVLITGES